MGKKNPFTLILIIFSLLTSQLSYAGGIVVGRTRVIYDENKREATLSVKNNSESNPFLIQSWVDAGAEKTRGPFIITPPLFRLNAQKESNLRISYNGKSLPADRESVFYINVKAIPSTPKNTKNELKLVVNTRIKLFYRPTSLSGKAFEAPKSLTFTRNNGHLIIKNPSPYHVVFSSLSIGPTFLKEVAMIAPLSELDVVLPANTSGSSVKWDAINDYGGTTEPYEQPL
ncbi:molecular chaperone [Rahnella victoriana]|uniref:Molecular chaperone n=1 Tax=Rahnella victoriana TaxID=1510570 RepID=A0ABS0DTJ9_9GAMM|nr:molecular chaperone [Rahnella victoriana]MBF7957215.1 molecular chaperone [Rahnella victoriana]VTQ56737.1 Chaperone protein focC precursor [Campylobacter jejuni]